MPGILKLAGSVFDKVWKNHIQGASVLLGNYFYSFFKTSVGSFTGGTDILRVEDAGTSEADYHLTPKSGVVADFNGTSSMITIDSSDFNFGDEDFTICALFKASSLASVNYIVTKWNSSGNHKSYSFRVNTDGTVRISMSSNGSSSSEVAHTTVLAIDTLYFLSVTYNATTDAVEIGINATDFESGTVASGLYSSSTADLLIGSINAGSTHANAEISNVLILSEAASQAQLLQVRNNPEYTKDFLVDTVGITDSAIKGFYPLAENGGSITYDYSGNKNDGVNTSITYLDNQSGGRQLALQGVSRYRFQDGVNDYDEFHIASTPTQSTFSAVMWVCYEGTSPNYLLTMRKYPYQASSLLLVTQTNGLYLRSHENEANYLNPGALNLGQMYKFALNFDGTTVNMWQDDVLVYSGNDYSGDTFKLGWLSFGADAYGNNNFSKGCVDGFQYFSSVKSESFLKAMTEPDITDADNILYVTRDLETNGVYTLNGSPTLINVLEYNKVDSVETDLYGVVCQEQSYISDTENFLNLSGDANVISEAVMPGVKIIQFILNPKGEISLPNILTNSNGNRLVYTENNVILSDYGITSVMVNETVTTVINEDVSQLVTIEYTNDILFKDFYLGSDEAETTFTSFKIDKLSLFTEESGEVAEILATSNILFYVDSRATGLLDEEAVGNWQDLAGDNTPIQTNASYKGTFDLDTLESGPGITMGTNDFVETPSSVFRGLSEFTVIVWGKFNQTSSNCYIIRENTSDTGAAYYRFYFAIHSTGKVVNGIRADATGSPAYLESSTTTHDNTYLTIVRQYKDNDHELWVDGVSVDTDTSTALGTIQDVAPGKGVGLQFNDAQDVADTSQGVFGGAIVISGTLTDDERNYILNRIPTP